MGFTFNPLLWFVCKLCKQTFPDADALKAHKIEKHLANCLGIKCIVFEERLLDHEWIPPDQYHVFPDLNLNVSSRGHSSKVTYSKRGTKAPLQSSSSNLNVSFQATATTTENDSFGNPYLFSKPACSGIINKLGSTSKINNAEGNSNSPKRCYRRKKRKYLAKQKPHATSSFSGRNKWNIMTQNNMPEKLQGNDDPRPSFEESYSDSEALDLSKKSWHSADKANYNDCQEQENKEPEPTNSNSLTRPRPDDDDSDADKAQFVLKSNLTSNTSMPVQKCGFSKQNNQGVDPAALDTDKDAELSDLDESASESGGLKESPGPVILQSFTIPEFPGQAPKQEQPDSPVNSNSSRQLPENILEIELDESSPLDPNSEMLTKPYLCGICFSFFRTQQNLAKHALHVHSTDRPFKCSHCPATFKYNESMRRHLIIHGRITPHKCRFCGKSCSSNLALSNHERTHTNDRPFKCEVANCSYAFPSKTSLTLHTRMKHGEELGLQEFPCPICGKNFGLKCFLKRHIQSHLTIRKVRPSRLKP